MVVSFSLAPKRAAKRRRPVPSTLPAAPSVVRNQTQSAAALLRDPLVSGKTHSAAIQELIDTALLDVEAATADPQLLMQKLELQAAKQHTTRTEQMVAAGNMVEEMSDLQVGLIISLYGNHFTLNNSATELPYDRQNKAFLRSVDALRLPVELTNGWFGRCHDGCLLVNLRDYRNVDEAAEEPPRQRRLLLWPTQESVEHTAADICDGLASSGMPSSCQSNAS